MDWYPWCDEAFEKARREDKPVFLSIGYSTCHWCHVMEKESFENEAVAEVMNRSFVAIKVDREERPDIDSIYISVCQLMTGSAGWPLSIFMDCDKRPFFAGTYFPNDDSKGRAAFIPLLKSVEKAWKINREELIRASDRVVSALMPKENKSSPIDRNFPDAVYKALKYSFDSEYGGFSPPPKFPSPNAILFLMRYYAATGDNSALEMCRSTLNSMRRGGIFDHIGFGFSRYSTDRKWLVPHFEKMLYDNALLCIAYIEFYSITKDYAYARTAKEIMSYLTSKMRSETGGYFTSEDADSEGIEGKYYVFSVEEVGKVLGEDADEFCRLYDITVRGNYEVGNIPNLINFEIPEEKKGFAEKCRLALWVFREKRIRPHLDDKILTSQNGLMIAALAIAGRTFHDDSYLQMGKETVDFIRRNMLRGDGTLLARYRDGEARYSGYDEDYAFTIWGLLELYQACLDPCYLELADSLNRVFLSRFYDYDGGGFYQTDADAEKHIIRPKNIYDGTMPSSNSIAVFNLMRLARLTEDDELLETAKHSIESIMEELNLMPAAYTFHAINILYDLNGGTNIVLRSSDISSLKDMTKAIDSKYRPFLTVRAIINDMGADKDKDQYMMINNMTTAYICGDCSCKPPVSSPIELEALLE